MLAETKPGRRRMTSSVASIRSRTSSCCRSGSTVKVLTSVSRGWSLAIVVGILDLRVSDRGNLPQEPYEDSSAGRVWHRDRLAWGLPRRTPASHAPSGWPVGSQEPRRPLPAAFPAPHGALLTLDHDVGVRPQSHRTHVAPVPVTPGRPGVGAAPRVDDRERSVEGGPG